MSREILPVFLVIYVNTADRKLSICVPEKSCFMCARCDWCNAGRQERCQQDVKACRFRGKQHVRWEKQTLYYKKIQKDVKLKIYKLIHRKWLSMSSRIKTNAKNPKIFNLCKLIERLHQSQNFLQQKNAARLQLTSRKSYIFLYIIYIHFVYIIF